MQGKNVNIFFAYTSDSMDLLALAKKQVELLNNSIAGKVLFHIREWRTYVKSEMGRPEDVILRQMPIPENHLFVGVFRFLYGTPSGNVNPETGKKFRSAMEEEFSIAYRLWKEHRKPEIMVFRSVERIPPDIPYNYKQLEALKTFFKEFSAKGSHPGLYKEFDSKETFSDVFLQGLLSYAVRLIEADTVFHDGLSNVFFDTDNPMRNQVKQDAMRTSAVFRLQANTGHAFLAPRGFHNSLFRRGLERGMTARFVVLNPWSVTAVFSLLRVTDFRRKSDYDRYLRGEFPAGQLMDIYAKSHEMLERLNHCLFSYAGLRKEFGNSIDLRLSDRDMSNSILLTDQFIFYEPYYSVLEKDKRGIATFELQATADSMLYQDTSAYFEKLWSSSYKYRYFEKNKNFFKERLRAYLEQARPVGRGGNG